MRPRSPIEMMVDKACGITAEDLARPPPEPRPPLDEDKVTKALLRLADAAGAWSDARSLGLNLKRYENRLQRAVTTLDALGWR